jgi:Putative zinc-finger/Anti-sigma-K factor rskA, C-terminal
MRCEEFRDDLEAFALGALDAAQTRRIAAHLRTCADCTKMVNAYHVALDYMALSVPLYHASPRLKDRILGGVGAFRAPAYLGFMGNRWVARTAAACLLAVAIGGVIWAILLSAEVGRLRRDNAHLAELTQLDSEQRVRLLAVQGELNFARSEQRTMSRALEEQSTLIVLALDPGLIPSELQGTQLQPLAHCQYVWSGKQGLGALTCKDLATTGSTLTYELWATKGDKTLPLGSFGPRTDGSANLLVKFPPETPGPVVNMWVTLESAQGARVRPSNEVVLTRAPDPQATR